MRTGLEPLTFKLWANRVTSCSILTGFGNLPGSNIIALLRHSSYSYPLLLTWPVYLFGSGPGYHGWRYPANICTFQPIWWNMPLGLLMHISAHSTQVLRRIKALFSATCLILRKKCGDYRSYSPHTPSRWQAVKFWKYFITSTLISKKPLRLLSEGLLINRSNHSPNPICPVINIPSRFLMTILETQESPYFWKTRS